MAILIILVFSRKLITFRTAWNVEQASKESKKGGVPEACGTVDFYNSPIAFKTSASSQDATATRINNL